MSKGRKSSYFGQPSVHRAVNELLSGAMNLCANYKTGPPYYISPFMCIRVILVRYTTRSLLNAMSSPKVFFVSGVEHSKTTLKRVNFRVGGDRGQKVEAVLRRSKDSRVSTTICELAGYRIRHEDDGSTYAVVLLSVEKVLFALRMPVVESWTPSSSSAPNTSAS